MLVKGSHLFGRGYCEVFANIFVISSELCSKLNTTICLSLTQNTNIAIQHFYSRCWNAKPLTLSAYLNIFKTTFSIINPELKGCNSSPGFLWPFYLFNKENCIKSWVVKVILLLYYDRTLKEINILPRLFTLVITAQSPWIMVLIHCTAALN